MLHLCNPSSPDGFIIVRNTHLLEVKKKKTQKQQNQEKLCSAYE